MSKKTLLVVGSLNYDLILSSPRLPRDGETVTGASFSESCGGKGANQAVAAARFLRRRGLDDVEVVFAGAVGRDVFGERQLGQLAADGIDTGRVLTLDDVSTGTSAIWVDSGTGENRILNAPGANECFSPECIADLPFTDAAALCLQNEIPAATTAALCERASAHGLPVLWDPAPFAPGGELPVSPSDVTWVTPNETEAESILGRPLGKEPVDDAAALVALGFGTAVLTLGAGGVAVARAEGSSARYEARSVEAVDTTAAGDAFAGAFAASLAAGSSEDEAIEAGIGYASLAVSRVGAQSSFPT